MIHGDIKPQNVLVFKDATGKTSVKVSDFGYSTLAVGEAGKVLLPKSRPWNAPENLLGEFEVPEAKKADVYSFGILCLWVLLGSISIPQSGIELTFEASSMSLTSLEHLKNDDKVEHIASQLMESVPLVGLNDKLKKRLKEFFSLTVPFAPAKRTSDFARLISLLSQKRCVSPKVIPQSSLKKVRTRPQILPARPLETTSKLSSHEHFRVRINPFPYSPKYFTEYHHY